MRRLILFLALFFYHDVEKCLALRYQVQISSTLSDANATALQNIIRSTKFSFSVDGHEELSSSLTPLIDETRNVLTGANEARRRVTRRRTEKYQEKKIRHATRAAQRRSSRRGHALRHLPIHFFESILCRAVRPQFS